MKPIEELILYTLKHIIERDSMESELKKKTDKDISNKIMKQLFVRETKGVCCDMDENILDGLKQSDDEELRDCEKCGMKKIYKKPDGQYLCHECIDTLMEEDKQEYLKGKKFALEEKSE